MHDTSAIWCHAEMVILHRIDCLNGAVCIFLTYETLSSSRAHMHDGPTCAASKTAFCYAGTCQEADLVCLLKSAPQMAVSFNQIAMPGLSTFHPALQLQPGVQPVWRLASCYFMQVDVDDQAQRSTDVPVEKMQKECTLPGSFADTAESSLFAARQCLIWLVTTEL